MAVHFDFVRTVEKAAVGAMIEFAVTTDDLVTVFDLTGYSAWVSFSYPGSAPHAERAGTVSAANGLVLYSTTGDEFPTVGRCQMQLTISSATSGLGTGRGFFEASMPVVSRDVIEVTT